MSKGGEKGGGGGGICSREDAEIRERGCEISASFAVQYTQIANRALAIFEATCTML